MPGAEESGAFPAVGTGGLSGVAIGIAGITLSLLEATAWAAEGGAVLETGGNDALADGIFCSVLVIGGTWGTSGFLAAPPAAEVGAGVTGLLDGLLILSPTGSSEVGFGTLGGVGEACAAPGRCCGCC